MLWYTANLYTGDEWNRGGLKGCNFFNVYLNSSL